MLYLLILVLEIPGAQFEASRAIYLAEKIWFFSWLSAMLFSLTTHLVATVLGYISPRLLLNACFMTTFNNTFLFSLLLIWSIYFTALFVDVFKYYFILRGWKFSHWLAPTESEVRINFITRFT